MERKHLFMFAIVLMYLVYGSFGLKGKTRQTAFQQKVQKEYAPRMKAPNPDTDSDSSNQFSDVLEYTMFIEGEGQVDLRLLRDRFIALPETLIHGRDGNIATERDMTGFSESVAFYTDVNGHGSFACIQHQTGQGQAYCELAALFEVGEESCYISSGATEADCTSVDTRTGLINYFDMPPDGQSNWKPTGSATVHQSRKKRRSLLPESLPTTPQQRLQRSILPEPGHKTVEIAFMLDNAFMTTFYERHPDDVTAAQNEARMYVTLLTNEMNVYLATIKEVSSGSTDIYAYPTDIVFPEKGTDFAWSIYYKDGSYLRAGTGFDTTLRQTVNSGFTDRQWDHVMALTGLDLFDVDTNSKDLLGYAYRSTVCFPNWHFYSAYKYSINEVQTYNIGRIAAHELGHALGMTHDGDGDGCPEKKYIMSRSIFRPYSSTSNTYFRFSTCSVTDMENHLKSMPNCTADNSFTQAQFTAFFCSGLPGSQDDSLDRQCQRTTGWVGSTACKAPSGDTGCYARYRIRCRVRNGYCGPYLKYVWNGTPCGTGKVCYRGKCIDKFSICEPSKTTSSTTITTTTKPSTTTATSTRSPVLCTCCGYRKYKRVKCCKIGRNTLNGAACYCCRELRGVKPPEGFNGPRF